MKLLYDVLQYDPPEIKKAVLFVTNNALVCDTQEDAMKVAYEIDDGLRYDAVALDGTFYQKSGLISGGSRDLEKKAARWNDKQLSTLKQSKEKYSEDLREAMKKSRKESELHTVKLQIKGRPQPKNSFPMSQFIKQRFQSYTSRFGVEVALRAVRSREHGASDGAVEEGDRIAAAEAGEFRRHDRNRRDDESARRKDPGDQGAHESRRGQRVRRVLLADRSCQHQAVRGARIEVRFNQ